MLRQLRRLSRPALLLLLMVPVLLCLACFVEFMRLEDQSSEWRTAWQVAVWGDTANVKQMLNENKINREDLSSMLLLASEDNFDQAVKTVLALGANTRCKDSKGHTALQIAQNKGHWKVVRILHQVGVTQ